MGKSKKKKEFDVHNMTPDEQLKFESAQELVLDEKLLQKGWKSLTSKESGRIGEGHAAQVQGPRKAAGRRLR